MKTNFCIGVFAENIDCKALAEEVIETGIYKKAETVSRFVFTDIRGVIVLSEIKIARSDSEIILHPRVNIIDRFKADIDRNRP